MQLLLASHNLNKKKEMQGILPASFQILDLSDLNITDEIEEYGASLEENALIKVRYLHHMLKLNCIGEDSGLEVEALNGAPGIYSARYAGPEKKSNENIKLLLKNMEHSTNRNAQFRTVIALILNNTEYLFEGVIKGTIAHDRAGLYGFGYDPVFIPEFYNQTFAELGDEVKLKISHRSRAVQKLVSFINTFEKIHY